MLKLHLLQAKFAIEYKRPNEGLHGVLTALGQAFAYISKGYQGAAIVIPDKYPTCSDPAAQIIKFINAANSKVPIGVYTYKFALIAPGSVSFKGIKENKPLTFFLVRLKRLLVHRKTQPFGFIFERKVVNMMIYTNIVIQQSS